MKRLTYFAWLASFLLGNGYLRLTELSKCSRLFSQNHMKTKYQVDKMTLIITVEQIPDCALSRGVLGQDNYATLCGELFDRRDSVYVWVSGIDN